MKRDWFVGVQNEQEARKRYFEHCKRYHPDVAGESEENTARMQEINSEYELVVKQLLSGVHQHFKTKEEYYYTEQQQETWWRMHSEFRDIIEKIVRLRDVKIEVCGIFIYITGDTKKYADYLGGQKIKKEYKGKTYFARDGGIGFVWSGKKMAWVWHPEDWQKRSKQRWDMSSIRMTFGSRGVDGEEIEHELEEGGEQ